MGFVTKYATALTTMLCAFTGILQRLRHAVGTEPCICKHRTQALNKPSRHFTRTHFTRINTPCCMHTRAHTRTYACARTPTHTCTYTRTHTHGYARMYARICHIMYTHTTPCGQARLPASFAPPPPLHARAPLLPRAMQPASPASTQPGLREKGREGQRV